MAEYDPRILRVGIQVGDLVNWYQELTLSASGSKSSNDNQADCTVKLTNLSKEVRDYLLKETSPFNKKATKKRIVVQAGRQSTGVVRVFEGDITKSSISQPPDIELTLTAKANNAMKGKMVTQAFAEQAKLSEIAKKVAEDLELSLDFQAADKNIRSYSYTGPALKQVTKLAEMGNVNAYIDDSFLVVKDSDKPLMGKRKVLSVESGMVGIPELTEKGVKVKFLFDPDTTLGGELKIESNLNPAVAGDYIIYKLDFSLSNHSTDFYWTAEAKRK